MFVDAHAIMVGAAVPILLTNLVIACLVSSALPRGGGAGEYLHQLAPPRRY